MPSKLVLATSIPLVPLTCTALYLTYLNYRISRKKISSHTTPHLQDSSLERYLPKETQENKGQYILHHELVRASVPISALSSSRSSSLPEIKKDGEREHEKEELDIDTEDILTSFLRHTMTSFTSLPPAYAIRHALKSCPPSILRTFSPTYLRTLTFQLNDRVCGVYVVSSRSEGRVVLGLDAPEGYVGPVVEGMLIIEVEVDGKSEDLVRLRNHTVLWREKGKGAGNVLESGVGRWVHAGMVRWMVERGVGGVVSDWKTRKMEKSE